MKRLVHPLAVVAVAAALIGIVSLLGNDYYLRIAFMMCVYYLCAAGMNVLVGYAGQKSLGQAGLFAAGAYGVALLTSRTDMDPWLALLLAAVISGLCGVLIALPSLRVKGPYLAMVTLAFGIVVEKLVGEWTDVFGGAQGIYGIRPLTWNGAPLDTTQWVVLGIVLSAALHLLLRNLLQGRFGRALLSLQADEIASSSVGVRVYRAKVMAFVVAAVTCGIAGALVAQQNQYINSDFITFHLSIFILLLVLFGGAGSMYGPIVGAVLLTLTDALLARWPSAQHFLYGFLLLFALYVMPGGVVGLVDKWVSRSRHRGEGAGGQGVPGQIGPGGEGELLVVQGVTKSYGGVKPAQDVSFSLQRGHIHALIGPNGAGKSTMINMLTGVIQPDAGAIRFLGENIVGRAAHAICCLGLGRTFQHVRLLGQRSVIENVMLGAHLRANAAGSRSMLRLDRAEEAALMAEARCARSSAAASARMPTRPRPRSRYGQQRASSWRARWPPALGAAARRARGRPAQPRERELSELLGAAAREGLSHPDGRARHGPRDVDLGPHHRARLRHQDRRGLARRSAGQPARARGLPGRRRRRRCSRPHRDEPPPHAC
jgi:branched-chain amino acid transport system permease protein